MGIFWLSPSTNRKTAKNAGFIPTLKRKCGGFTLIEMLVVIGVIGVLTAILIGYSRQSSRNLALTSSQAKALSLFSRAKFLSIETFFDQLDNPPDDLRICAYGVHVDQETGEIFIFQDRVEEDPIDEDECSSSNNVFDSDDDVALSSELDYMKLDDRILEIRENPATTLENVVFIPPDPDVIINDNPSDSEGAVEVGLIDDEFSYTITVDRSGQVRTD